MKKLLSSKYPYLILAAVCAVLIIILQFEVIRYVAALMSTDGTIDVTAQNDVGFTVNYLDNDFFGPGPADHDLHYLMSFTDFVEVNNAFSVDISQETPMQYHYSVDETLIIRHQASGDRTTDPIVYRESTLIDEKTGELNWATVSFGSGPEDVPGGAYRIDPKHHIESYKAFEAADAATMATEDVRSVRAIDFSAELLINFNYELHFPEMDGYETVVVSLLIPLSDEVFSPEIQGDISKDISLIRYTMGRPGTAAISITIIAAIGLIFGLCFGIYRYRQEKCEKRREAGTIFRKYSDEIVFSKEAADIKAYVQTPVNNFNDLLKLAINSGKHILCHQDDTGAWFVVIADGSAYTYDLVYTP